ncbi:P-loop containing nucleoside triphosphate hydrolase protein [Yamadazyma tenuis ATCC 10573]|uniref:p-loop containing nucleoside triphosphate hydrolase protein n=2 Tax=Candida tenuis TaxID=2315449 RepID=G3AX90_CANTC|nr:P-loop containing nucleoside triphosphate hydrolase protein [Yamadazyma tenuis ATCC 10573]EGV66718.1 P-loop containing nucleoside triphosphate hydrolase protein [Yamadazyma tenuis ATCC 10573]
MVQAIVELRRDSRLPLAQRLRPKTLDDFYGQEKLVGPNGLLRNILRSQEIPSFILWGVPGVGKTTLARIIANSTDYRFLELSGPTATAAKLREAFTAAENDRKLTGKNTLIFLDEIHRFNKAQQDLLLPVIEKGIVTVLGATTENPSFTLNNALLSRMHTFVMESLDHKALVRIIHRGLYLLNQTRKYVFHLHLISLTKDATDYIADLGSGDARVSLNILESVNAYLSGTKFQHLESGEEKINSLNKLGVVKIDRSVLEPLLSTRNYQKMYHHHGESHYDTISAFHKSVRGSDPDAAIFYLTKMLVGGEDPLFIARRMIVIASEDIGLRDSSCLPFAVAAKDALEFIGMPEGEIILAHCAVRLAKAPKSTKSYRALRSAQNMFQENPDATSYKIPLHLRNAPTKLMKEMGYGDTYRYNPSFENGRVSQEYMPEELKGTKFVDEKHFLDARDPELSDKDYLQAEEDRLAYLEFKKQRKQLKEQLIQKVIDHDCKPMETNEHNDTGDVGEIATTYPYDEFLSREDQPEYFDGNEKDQYSDDPDCSTNFEESYEYLPHEDTICDEELIFEEDNDITNTE